MGALRSTTKQTIQAYASWAEVYLKEWHRCTYRIPLHLQIWIEHLPPRSLVLDLGCGPGQDSRHLRRRGFYVVGLDLTHPFLQVARRRSPKLPLVQADIEHLPFYTKSLCRHLGRGFVYSSPKINTQKGATTGPRPHSPKWPFCRDISSWQR